MNKTYITSDLHFGHNKEFLFGPRGFDSIDEHDEAVIKNWNSVVDNDDIVFILGDLMLNDNASGITNLRRLNGHKIIILGNHDTATREVLYENLWNTEIIGYASPFRHKGYTFFLTHYPCLVSNYDADKPLQHRTISLCGHTHTKDRWKDFDKGLIYHVELDAHDNKPKLLDEIIEEIKAKLDEG